MIWFYERGTEQLRCEMRTSNDGDGFELIVNWPDGNVHTEHYAEQGRLLRRWCELDRAWEAQGWGELSRLLARASRSPE